MRTVPSRGVREIALLGGVAIVLVVGTLFAQQRQMAWRTPLDAAGFALLIGTVVLLIGRRRRPLWVFAGVVLVTGGYLALGYPYGPVFVSAAVAAFALADSVSAVTGAVATCTGIAFWILCEAPRFLAGDGVTPGLLSLAAGFGMFFVVPLWLASLRGRARDAATATAERHRREMGEQRLELAREVHDVVAHNLAVIGVQSGAALRAFDRDPERARDALTAISQTTRQALAEVRGTVEILRGPDASGDPDDARLPAGELVDLPALVETTRAAGVDVTLSLTEEQDLHTTPLIERTAYRIVQESLTNAVRHAPGAAVRIGVEARTGELAVRVGDDGPGLRERPEGRGITGMRERVASVGGSFTISSGWSGGLVVQASLPLAGADR